MCQYRSPNNGSRMMADNRKSDPSSSKPMCCIVSQRYRMPPEAAARAMRQEQERHRPGEAAHRPRGDTPRSQPSPPGSRRSAETRSDRCAGSARSASPSSAATGTRKSVVCRGPKRRYCSNSRLPIYHTTIVFRHAPAVIKDSPGLMPIGYRSPSRTPWERRKPASQGTTPFSESWS